MARFRTFSMSRYNGGVAVKRLHGSSTVTVFAVDDTETGKRYRDIRGFGRTPGERHTYAVRKVLEIIKAESTPLECSICRSVHGQEIIHACE